MNKTIIEKRHLCGCVERRWLWGHDVEPCARHRRFALWEPRPTAWILRGHRS